ncbi:3-deoxy-7-phosphoheptulonate synthase [Candidatus Sumerlaeota bacterium]|nr:3-deoxy-7-phosphoheptulonate synthase [Candidatus Sumerlaeota bacterium]
MIVVMERGASREKFEAVCRRIEELGYKTHPIFGVERTVIGCVGHEDKTPLESLETMPGVEAVVPILKPYKLVGRELKKEKTVVDVRGVAIGATDIVVMAGPCSIESEEQILEVARAVKAQGAQFLRGGAFKPRTSPYSFQGLRERGLSMMRAAADETGLRVVTELVSVADVDLICEYTDMIQIGARNAQNFALLQCAGRTNKPILLKRGMATTVEEYLMAAEYILSEGNYNLVLCERGIRTFENATRFTLDLSLIPVVRGLSHLPIVVDPSHGTGHWRYVASMALAAVAAGADGLIIEVHPDPAHASSDGPQSLKPTKFAELMQSLRRLAPAVDRNVP